MRKCVGNGANPLIEMTEVDLDRKGPFGFSGGAMSAIATSHEMRDAGSWR
ncbi:hypothetical protein GGE67_006296 [Rhizobium leucaenae]|uniref:Uncharacterized protein n=1 Tax=Rhizobium leucaenae TaxID=29450 RepID=A0A7W7A0J2_9HYPH|nr:hypothetical protein [Rhizobium leucaenae]MBB6305626.1 hypothetical protein [Rhizobium leucaenae]